MQASTHFRLIEIYGLFRLDKENKRTITLGEKVHSKYLDLRKNVVIFRREKMVDVKKTQTTVTAAKELSADEKVEEAKRYTDELVNKALVAEEAYATYSQEQVDKRLSLPWLWPAVRPPSRLLMRQ